MLLASKILVCEDLLINREPMEVDDADTHNYTYDKIYRLTRANYPSVADANYYYDPVGNRRKVEQSGTTNYTANNLNEYTAVGSTNYGYDDNGNLADDGAHLYYYDYENHLIDVNDKTTGNRIAHYVYDYLGRRVGKTVGSTTTTYCYDNDQIVAEYENGTLVRKFVYGPGIDEPVCMITSSGIYFYHFDGLGSVIALSDNDGDIIERYSYDVFGEPNRVSSVGNPYMFTGRAYDPNTGLYDYRARVYKPQIGRFLQTDPIRYSGGLNLYTYCDNNPVIYVDPLGLFENHDKWFGGNGFEYNRLDTGWTHPLNPFCTWMHFRDRSSAINDAMYAARRGNKAAFEGHMHEVQDTYAHGVGLEGVAAHVAGSLTGHSPDASGDVKSAFEMTRALEAFYEANQAWLDLQYQQALEDMKEQAKLEKELGIKKGS